jgi:hypothetical protein
MMDQAYSKVKAAILSFYIFFMFGAVGPGHTRIVAHNRLRLASTISNSWLWLMQSKLRHWGHNI